MLVEKLVLEPFFSLPHEYLTTVKSEVGDPPSTPSSRGVSPKAVTRRSSEPWLAWRCAVDRVRPKAELAVPFLTEWSARLYFYATLKTCPRGAALQRVPDRTPPTRQSRFRVLFSVLLLRHPCGDIRMGRRVLQPGFPQEARTFTKNFKRVCSFVFHLKNTM